MECPVEDAGSRLQTWDIVAIVIYFVIVITFGLLSSLYNRGSVEGYFLGGRNMNWILVGASLFASNIGSGHFIGLAGSGAATGIGIAAFELNALFTLMLLGWIFVPVYISSGVFTMPEYIMKRFGGQRIRIYLSAMALLLSIFTKVSADLFAGAVFLQQSLDWNLYLAIVLLLAVAALFTITGGLTAVMVTDFVQTVIMLIGATWLMIRGFMEVGGFTGVIDKYPIAVPNVTLSYMANPSSHSNHSKYAKCGIPPEYSFHLFRPADASDLPWPGIVFGLTISATWYLCADQVMVQRVLAAKNLTHAKAGTILDAYLKILPLFLIVVPGMIARILYKEKIACVDPEVCYSCCRQRAGCTNAAYPQLVLTLMPEGARGMMLAVMMAALMSSLTSIFNSSSTIFTMDIWLRIRKNAKDMELMVVGRVFVLFMVAVGIVWIPIVQNFGELFHYIQSITSFLSPPVCAIYVLAVSWKRINEKGAFWALMVGLVVGVVRFAWEFSYPRVACGEPDPRPAVISKVHYLHFGIILFGITFIVAVVVSLLTEPIPDKYLHGLTYFDRYSQVERTDIQVLENERKRDKKQYEQDFEMKTGRVSGIDGPAAESSHTSHSDILADRDSYDTFPWYKKVAYWICGIEKQRQPELSEEERKAREKMHTSLEEREPWSTIVNVNAVIVMAVGAFIWGFFG